MCIIFLKFFARLPPWQVPPGAARPPTPSHATAKFPSLFTVKAEDSGKSQHICTKFGGKRTYGDEHASSQNWKLIRVTTSNENQKQQCVLLRDCKQASK